MNEIQANRPCLRFEPVIQSSLEENWERLALLSADQNWAPWTKENFLHPLPRKWEFSREILLDGALVGYVLSSQRGGFLWIHRLVVASSHRGKGIGRAALNEMGRIARDAGLLGVVLKVPSASKRSLSFYRTQGFAEISKTDDYHMMLRKKTANIVVGIHQPNYLPWLGYFFKIYRSNFFIYLDDVEFPKGSYVNRSKVCINGAESWLTVPANRSLGMNIMRAYPSNPGWHMKHLKTLENTYRRSPYFDEFFPRLAEMLSRSPDEDFASLNISLIEGVCSWIGLNCIGIRSSQMGIDGSSDERLARLVRAVGGDTYMSGSGGKKYQSQSTFSDRGVELSYADYQAYPYRQLSGGFVPGLSVVDALFNIGARQILDSFESLTSSRS